MKIHHIGYVVNDIAQYQKNLLPQKVIASVYDEVQKADLVLIETDNVLVELIQPKEKDAPTHRFLQKYGNAYHHLCYEVDTKKTAEAIIASKRMIKTLGWIYAPLLKSEVIFAWDRNRQVVEFVLSKN